MLFDPDSLVGRTFAGYRLENILGAGGAGTVYLGVGKDGQKVAVKVLAPAVKVTPEQLAEFRRRFLREAQLLERLEHPHILAVLASGEDEETGQVYMIMPYLAGGTLAARVAGGPLPLEEVVTYITQVAEALDFANAQGVVHRDIKPSNVLLNDQGQAVLADFGIAKLVDAITTQLTMTSQILGTPEYMSPEQIRNQPVSAATDVFGVGALAYHLLTGQAPFAGTSMPEIVQKVLFDTPTPVRQLRLEVPPPAEAVVLKALAKDPAQRFANAGGLAQALAQGMRGEWPAGVQPPPPTPPTQAAQLPLTMTPAGTSPPTVEHVAPPAPVPYRGYPGQAAASPGASYLPPASPDTAPTEIATLPTGRQRGGGRLRVVVATIAAVVVLALLAASAAWIAGATGRGTSSSHSQTHNPTTQPTVDTLSTPTGAATATAILQPTATATLQPTATATPDRSLHEVNNNDPAIVYSADCYYNHGLSPLLYNDDVQICGKQGDSFTYTFSGTSIYLITVYWAGHGATISCYIDNSLTDSYNTDSNQGADSNGFAFGIKLPIATSLVYGQHTASCEQTSADGTVFFIDALLINA